MTIGELQDTLNSAVILKQTNQMYTGNIRDKEVLITIEGDSIGSRPYCKIQSAGFGFDWEHNQFRIEPSEKLFTKDNLSNVQLPKHIKIKNKDFFTCRICNKKVETEDNYCKFCGTKLKKGII